MKCDHCLGVGGATPAILLFLFSGPQLSAQSTAAIVEFGAALASQEQASGTAESTDAPTGIGATRLPDSSPGEQTKRILGIVPNFEAVSADTPHLPPLSVRQKFWLTTEGTFDYSSFISVGIQAAVEQATKTYPEFHQGAAGYGRYYWHTFVDSGIENYIGGAILPAITHEDPRYYTLARGGFFHRTLYAVSRLCITRTDAGRATFNVSEILGSGVAAEVSSRYYPRQERGASETLERWASQLLNDGVGNVVEEFWPDIHNKLFHRH
jgi:hypothetical protein